MTVRITPEAARQFEALPTLVKVRMRNVFRRLERWPNVSGARPLRGALAGQYRMRTGDYRAQFRVEGDALLVTRVGHRDGFYE